MSAETARTHSYALPGNVPGPAISGIFQPLWTASLAPLRDRPRSSSKNGATTGWWSIITPPSSRLLSRSLLQTQTLRHQQSPERFAPPCAFQRPPQRLFRPLYTKIPAISSSSTPEVIPLVRTGLESLLILATSSCCSLAMRSSALSRKIWSSSWLVRTPRHAIKTTKTAVTTPQAIRRYSIGPDNTDSTVSIETSALEPVRGAPD